MMTTHFSRIALVFLACALIGCVNYQKKSFMRLSGYKDERVTTDTFVVTYIGKQSNSMMTTEYLATVRAAELAALYQCESFSILSSTTDIRERTTVLPGHSYSNTTSSASVTGYSTGYGRYRNYNAYGSGSSNTFTTYMPPTTITQLLPEVNLGIRIFSSVDSGTVKTREILTIAYSKGSTYQLSKQTLSYLGVAKK